MDRLKNVALCCIVRDEEKVIGRLLESVAPLIDFAVIVDTGSTDNTEKVALESLKKLNIPHEYSHEKWKDFSHNRNLALEKLRNYTNIDYGFTIDADEVLSLEEGFDLHSFKKSLTDDLYHVKVLFADTLYERPLIFNNKKRFYYKGVLHEFITCDQFHSTKSAQKIKIIVNTDGKRSRDQNKYKKDSLTLEEVLKKENDAHMVSRYTFYLAQSYRDGGNLIKALENYEKRANLGFFEQEIFESLYNITRVKAKLNYPFEDVLDAGFRARVFDGDRIEPIHEIIKHCRLKKRFNLGYMLGKDYVDFTSPKKALFKIHWVYDWGFWDEVAICAFYANEKKYSIELWQRALINCTLLQNKNKIPEEDANRITENIKYAKNNI